MQNNENIKANLEEAATPMIGISDEEYSWLKDIETRFTVLKNQMLHAEYCPIHTQVILGIENEYKNKELQIPAFMSE